MEDVPEPTDDAGDLTGMRFPLPRPLDAYTTRLYLMAVRTPGLTRLHMIAAGIPAEVVDGTIEELTDQGLLRPTGVETWEAIPPDVALPALASNYEYRARFFRDHAYDLSHVYRMARAKSGEPRPGVTVLRDTDELGEAYRTVSGCATERVWAAHDDSPRTSHLFSSGLDGHREVRPTWNGRPLRNRTTFDNSALQHPRSGEVLLARAEAGEEQRFLDGLPFSVVVADDTCAVVDLSSYDTSGAGSLLVHDRRFVLALQGLCETWWKLATPMAWEGIGELDRRSSFILSMLAAGATDATIAARAGLSQRTVERRVRALMSNLGAATRFQAGVQAARRGWI